MAKTYENMNMDELTSVSDKLKGEIAKLKAERVAVKDAMNTKLQFLKFDRMSDEEKEAMKIYVNSFSSETKVGKPNA